MSEKDKEECMNNNEQLNEENLNKEIRETKRRLEELIFMKYQRIVQKCKQKQAEQQQENTNQQSKKLYKQPFQQHNQFFWPIPNENYNKPHKRHNQHHKGNVSQFSPQYQSYQDYYHYQQQPWPQNPQFQQPSQNYSYYNDNLKFTNFDQPDKSHSSIKDEPNNNSQFNYQYSTWMQYYFQQSQQPFQQKMYQNQQPDFYRKFQKIQDFKPPNIKRKDKHKKNQEKQKDKKEKAHRKCPHPPSWWYCENNMHMDQIPDKCEENESNIEEKPNEGNQQREIDN